MFKALKFLLISIVVIESDKEVPFDCVNVYRSEHFNARSHQS